MAEEKPKKKKKRKVGRPKKRGRKPLKKKSSKKVLSVNNSKKILHFKKKNSIILTDIVPGAGHNKTPTVWLYTPQAELIELIEKQKNKIGLSRFTRK